MTPQPKKEQRSKSELQPGVRQFILSSRLLYGQDSRLDATAYTEEATRAEADLEASPFPKKSVGELCGTIWHPVQNQARSNFKRIYTAPQHGVPFVSSRSMFGLPLRPERHLSKLMRKLSDLMVPEGWIVLSRSGTVGNPLLINRSLAQCAISDHAIRIEPKAVESGYLYAFLASRYGQTLIEKGIYGSTVDELEPKHIAGIRVPMIDDAGRSRIHELIARAYQLRDAANVLFADAESELHSLLGVPAFSDEDIEYVGQTRSPRAFIVQSIDLGVRLDATHHVPVVRSAIHKLERGKFPLKSLGALIGAQNIDVPGRFVRIYVGREHGVPLLQSGQLPLMRPYGLKYISRSLTKGLNRWIVRKGWVLVTCSGTIGRTAVCSTHQDGWAASQHILRVKPSKQLHPGFLAVYCSTPYGQHQIKSKIYGGVVDELTADDMAQVIVPVVPYQAQEKIGSKVVRVFELRDEANACEERAIEELEVAIKHPSPLVAVVPESAANAAQR